MSREEDISLILESDRIFPPDVGRENRRRFIDALVQVLKRLPEDAFCYVELDVGFVVDDGYALALNVPWSRTFPSLDGRRVTVRYDQIVILRSAFQLSDKGLIGLIAHEIAHSLVDKDDHFENERAADALVTEWGFGDELRQKDEDQPG